jgi:hypothetical protein
MTEPSHLRRGAALTLVAATLAATVYIAIASAALVQVTATRPSALIAAWRNDQSVIAPVMGLSAVTVQRAVAARPLDPRTLNVAMVQAVGGAGEKVLGRWIATLARLGWRDTPALQNRMYFAAINSDLGKVVDISDALMRRRQVQDQTIPIMALFEIDPTLRPGFVRRLASTPQWRSSYLYATGHLRGRAQLDARYAVLEGLRRRGVALGRSELVSNINALVAGGLPERGFALWNSVQPGVSRPLNDPNFKRASVGDQTNNDTVPFEWEMTSGNGFDVGAYADAGHSALAIRWDGRGVPVFARQRTSALPGRYIIDVAVAPEDANDLSAFGIQLICEETGYVFRQQRGRTSRFVMEQAAPCAYPILEISGDIKGNGAPRQMEMRGLRMSRIGPDRN